MKIGRRNAWIEKIEPRLNEIAAWCRDGDTDRQIAAKLGIGFSTFNKYRAMKVELIESLKINKYIADLEVENQLLKRAKGYEYEEIVEEYYIDGRKIDGDPKKVKPDKIHRKIIKKIMPPDVTAQIFWLKNRQPEKWRDKKNIDANLAVSHDDWIKKLDDESEE